MAVVKELIRTEENGTISFGDYEKNQKSKVSDYPHQGDMYKVKTFKEITKLERNGMFVYESVPGTAVFDLAQDRRMHRSQLNLRQKLSMKYILTEQAQAKWRPTLAESFLSA